MFKRPGINTLMLPILVARFSSRNPTGLPRSYGDATRIKQALNGQSFALASRPIQRFSSRFPAVVFLVAQVWRLVQPIAISFSSTVLGLSNPFESRMVKAFASSLATRVPSAFEDLFPTTTMVSISASPTTAIAPGSSTRPNKLCSANLSHVSRPRAGEWLANYGIKTESGHRLELRSRSTTSVTMHF